LISGIIAATNGILSQADEIRLAQQLLEPEHADAVGTGIGGIERDVS
jgi:hypothetical protein